MTCGHCAKAIGDEVGALPGVTSAVASFDEKALVVTSDAALDDAAVQEAVTEAGDYTITRA